jgi:hypothetical protein
VLLDGKMTILENVLLMGKPPSYRTYQILIKELLKLQNYVLKNTSLSFYVASMPVRR